MNINKIVLDEIERCYCASHITVNGELKILLASEERDGPCYSYSGVDFQKKEVVWENAGGTMSIVEIPNTNGEFLAVQNFFPGFESQDAKIVWCRYSDDGFIIQDFIKLPYVHRFDLLEANGDIYFIGATLCSSKKERNDWTDPGKVWVGKLPKDPSHSMELKPIKDFLLKNHGYWRGKYGDVICGYVTCDSGIYAVVPPKGDADWNVVQILADRISDMASYDLDADGEEEIVTISPFHGNELTIRKKVSDGRYETIYTYPNPMDFAHAVWAGRVLGKPMVIFGVRRMDCELGFIIYDKKNNKYEARCMEKGAGTANIDVIHQKDRVLLIAANHAKNEGAVYILTK